MGYSIPEPASMTALLPVQFLDGPGGTPVAYAVHGSGPLLVCPAWWVSHLEVDWRHPPFRRFFERLGRSRTVVRYDRPGAGLSAAGGESDSLATEVAVLGAVLDHLGAESAALFAVSCAGPPALVFAARQPERVSRRRLAASLPGASLVTLDGDAHLPWEGAEEVAAVVEAFLASRPLEARGAEAAGDPGVRHDRPNREPVIGGERRPLTPLEHGLLCYLADRAGTVVTRDEALRDVWQQPFAGSNVVDAVVRTLRRKLGPHAGSIETVTGHGYRLSAPWP